MAKSKGIRSPNLLQPFRAATLAGTKISGGVFPCFPCSYQNLQAYLTDWMREGNPSKVRAQRSTAVPQLLRSAHKMFCSPEHKIRVGLDKVHFTSVMSARLVSDLSH